MEAMKRLRTPPVMKTLYPEPRQDNHDVTSRHPSVIMLDRQTGCQHCQVDGRAKITIGSWCDHVIFLEGWVVRNFLLEVKVLIYIKIE